MKVARHCESCAVFEGNTLVSGGFRVTPTTLSSHLESVESYDVFANKWSPMPGLVNHGVYHNLVVVRNKLFVISMFQGASKVFSNVTRNLLLLRPQIFGL